jgi:hypothetical protein
MIAERPGVSSSSRRASMSRTAWRHAIATALLGVAMPTRGSRGGWKPARRSVIALQPSVAGRRRPPMSGNHFRHVCQVSPRPRRIAKLSRPFAHWGWLPARSTEATRVRRNSRLV